MAAINSVDLSTYIRTHCLAAMALMSSGEVMAMTCSMVAMATIRLMVVQVEISLSWLTMATAPTRSRTLPWDKTRSAYPED